MKIAMSVGNNKVASTANVHVIDKTILEFYYLIQYGECLRIHTLIIDLETHNIRSGATMML